MSHEIEKTIAAYEERLKAAMLKSDIDELDQLLAHDMVFTNQLQVIFVLLGFGALFLLSKTILVGKWLSHIRAYWLSFSIRLR